MTITREQVKVYRSAVVGHDPDAPTVEMPLTVFDRFATNVHIAVLYAFSAPTSPNADIVSGLAKTLAHFTTLAGALEEDESGRPCVVVGGGGSGALVLEASVDCDLEDFLPMEPCPELRLLHPSDEDPEHLFQAQLNRFRCGGLVIGITAHHHVADGQSMSFFFDSWGRASRGEAIDRLPVFDRTWIRPREPPRVEFDHWGTDFIPPNSPELKEISLNWTDPIQSELTNILLHYSPEFIANLKMELEEDQQGGQGVKFTTFEALLGHLWRQISLARGLGDDEKSMVRVTVNGRRRLRPMVPAEYFGNLVLNAYPTMTGTELRDGGAAAAARSVRDAVGRVGDGYFRSFIDFGEVHDGEELVPCYDADGVILAPKLEVDSWQGFRFEGVDFGGGGRIRGFIPTWVPFEGMVMFIPSVDKAGGIDAFVTMLQEHANKLKQNSHSMA